MNVLLPWVTLVLYILLLLTLDFLVLHRKGKEESVKKSLYQTLFFILNALVFSIILYWFYHSGRVENINHLSPSEAVIKYLTGYIIELSLSVDNLFVIAMIFTSFKVKSQYQHKLLFMGILGAIIFRAILIGLGLALIHSFHQVTILFGVFLLFTALRMLKKEPETTEVKKPTGLFRLFRFSRIQDGGKLITKLNGRWVFTSLFGALLTIELTDLLFALDSIPAIFSVTTDPFIVYSSNIFAIMGLRSMYFFLSAMLERFRYLKYSVFSILVFVSIKLLTYSFIDIPELFSLSFIVVSLAIGIVVSLRTPTE